jgi:hypothetical protein
MGPALEAEIRRVREHAEKPENIYHPGDPIPGDNPAFVLRSGMYRVVYSFTQGPGTPIFRHISVSTARPGMAPNIMVVCTLCHMFGFTGAPLASDGGVATGLGPNWVVFRDGTAIAVQQAIG